MPSTRAGFARDSTARDGAFWGASFPLAVLVYDVFQGNSSNGPIDYTTLVATVAALTWTGTALPLSSTTRFGVRARNTVSGLGELNTDAVVTISVSAAGTDSTAVPMPPQGLRATPIAAAGLMIEWDWPYLRGPMPTGFHLYIGTSSVNYGTIIATVPFTVPGQPYRTTLTGLTSGTTYLVGVRAFNASGEESNILTTTATADGTPPANPTGLTATPTAAI